MQLSQLRKSSFLHEEYSCSIKHYLLKIQNVKKTAFNTYKRKRQLPTNKTRFKPWPASAYNQLKSTALHHCRTSKQRLLLATQFGYCCLQPSYRGSISTRHPPAKKSTINRTVISAYNSINIALDDTLLPRITKIRFGVSCEAANHNPGFLSLSANKTSSGCHPDRVDIARNLL